MTNPLALLSPAVVLWGRVGDPVSQRSARLSAVMDLCIAHNLEPSAVFAFLDRCSADPEIASCRVALSFFPDVLAAIDRSRSVALYDAADRFLFDVMAVVRSRVSDLSEARGDG